LSSPDYLILVSETVVEKLKIWYSRNQAAVTK